MRCFRVILLALLGLIAVAAAWATDYITVESKTVAAGATDVTVALRMANSDTLMGMTLPLEIRSITPGSRPISLRLEYAERLADRMDDIRIVNQYDTKDGICGQTGDSTYWTPLTWGGDTTVTVTHSPWGIALSSFRMSIANSLLPGEDSSGSILLHMDVTSVPGSFEIDTICTCPANHSVYVISVPGGLSPVATIPEFTKGVITISDCNCSYHGDLDGDSQITALDLGLLIDYLFAGGPAPPTDPGCPHTDRGDVNCDGFDNALDMSYLIDHLFAAGPPPCDPCACDPYPTSCP